VLLSNAVVFTGAPPTSTSYTVTGLSQSIAANDEITVKWTTPAWATNPTGAQLLLTLYFERT
jgi:acid phosphatase family membrane protein YuiD